MAERMQKFVSVGQILPQKRPAKARAGDFHEIYADFIAQKAAEQASRCAQCGVPFCQTHCPRAPAAVMVNLLAGVEGAGAPQGLVESLSVDGAHVHIYGKARSGIGRKMGHVTALGPTHEAALAIAQRAADFIRSG